MIKDWSLLLAVMLCVASISFTITTTSMFKWLREPISRIHHKAEELIHCPWCLGHWITFVIMWTCDVPRIQISSNSIVMLADFYNFMFTAFVITAPVGLTHYVLLRAYKPVAKAMVQRQIDKLGDQEPN